MTLTRSTREEAVRRVAERYAAATHCNAVHCPGCRAMAESIVDALDDMLARPDHDAAELPEIVQ